MKVLRAIGGFFAKIGRWIRDTAWIQPLLIVGGIFAIIFSIKPLTSWFKSLSDSGEASYNFYNSYRLSLSGAESNSSAADDLFKKIEQGDKGPLDGTKFFLSFVKKDCDGCKTCYPGFKLLRDNWNSSEIIWKRTDNKPFLMYTIFIDEKNDDGELLIDDFLRNHQELMNNINTNYISDTTSEVYAYYNNISSSMKSTYDSNLESIANTIGAKEEEEAEGFISPCTYLVDIKNKETKDQETGKVTDPARIKEDAFVECFFNFATDMGGKYETSTDYGKAYCLLDCWNQKDDSIWGFNYDPK